MIDDGSLSGAEPARRRLGDLRTRVISALFLVIAVLALTGLGGWPFRLLAVAIALAIFHEWMAMRRRPIPMPVMAAAWGLLALVLAGLLLGLSATWVFTGLALALIVCGLFTTFGGTGGWPVAGLVYAAAPAVAISYLRDGDRAGLAVVLFLFAVVWATDILAYFVGRAVGGPKLAPSISPGKTWSGAIGGAIAGAAAGMLVAFFGGATRGVFVMGVVGCVLSVVSQVGDLFESAVKRRCGVKDSGTMIPGHGGVMDRVDGLVTAAFVFYLMGALISGVDTPARAFFLQ